LFYPFFFAESLPVALFVILNLGLPLTILCYGSYRLVLAGVVSLLGEVLCYELILFSRLRDQTVIFQVTAVIMTCLMFIFFRLLRAYGKQHAEVQQLLESQEALNRELALAGKALQEQEKRAALAAITAGLAHEIHNPINYLQGNLVFLEENIRRMEKNQEDNRENRVLIEDTRDIISSYRSGFSRIIQIIGGLKTLFDPGNSRETRVSLNTLLHTIVDTLPADQARRIDLAGVGDYSLSAAPGDLFSLFSILFQNSFEAMGQEGSITVESEAREPGLVVKVRDDGPGIAPEAGIRIFDSFFTTKNNNLGLGLPLAKKIVEKYGGSLSLGNLPSRGCEVVIHVPDAL
jgi:signal transduction histidine kinase